MFLTASSILTSKISRSSLEIIPTVESTSKESPLHVTKLTDFTRLDTLMRSTPRMSTVAASLTLDSTSEVKLTLRMPLTTDAWHTVMVASKSALRSLASALMTSSTFRARTPSPTLFSRIAGSPKNLRRLRPSPRLKSHLLQKSQPLSPHQCQSNSHQLQSRLHPSPLPRLPPLLSSRNLSCHRLK